jgi:Zn-dependent protease with chaperone function
LKIQAKKPMNRYQYPPSPGNNHIAIDYNSNFKKEIKKVMFGIIFFAVVYLLLLFSSVLLAIACGLAGLGIIALIPNLLTIIAGLAIFAFGLMVMVFLLKFMFSKKTNDRSQYIEIHREEEQELFDFIDKINAETNSPKPKKIYISADVNAAVFYDSSFWSMFLPIRKNLVIGLGLVNTINLSEFKAVLAHEFGHFSQRSMKLGSYVYNANSIIYDMLYNNDSYSNL